MIQVAFDAHVIGERRTGNETYARGLIHAFENEPADDLRFVYYGGKAIEQLGLRSRTRRLRPFTPIVRIPLITPIAMAMDRVDIGHFQYTPPPFSPAKTVLTVHDISFEIHPEFFPPGLVKRLQSTVPWFIRKSDHTIVVSEATKKDIIAHYDASPDTISVIYNGVPPGFTYCDDADWCKNILQPLALTRPYFICVGNLGFRKNQQRLVSAFATLVREKQIECDLVLVGQPHTGAEAILHEIERKQIAHRVHVVGFVSDEEMLALYNQALFSVYPSLYEGFGLPVMESMACGTPVITSHQSSMPEIAGEDALLIDPRSEGELKEAILQLIDNPELRSRLAARGLVRASRFTWAGAARQTMDVYRKVAGS